MDERYPEGHTLTNEAPVSTMPFIPGMRDHLDSTFRFTLNSLGSI